MELLSFYSLNIVVGILLSLCLGNYGLHLVARKKSLEALMLGQSMQTGLLVGIFCFTLFTHDLSRDIGHISIIISAIFSLFVFLTYEKILHSLSELKNETALFFIVLSISLSYIFTAINPLVESHFVRSFVGDIIIAERSELLAIGLISLVLLVVFYIKRESFKNDTIDIALYSKIKNHNVYIFDSLIFLLMVVSIHIFGLLFTLGMLIVPAFMLNGLSPKRISYSLLFISLVNALAVFCGFVFNIFYEDLPTSPMIVICLIFLNGVIILMSKIFNK